MMLLLVMHVICLCAYVELSARAPILPKDID